MDRVVGSGAKWLDPQPATETGSPVFVGREPRYKPGETYWAGVGQFEGGEAELPPGTCQETWQGQQNSHACGCQAHQGPVPWIAGGLFKLKMPNKTELALVPVTAAEEELGKAPSAKSKAATSELGKASLQEKAHVLGKAPASAKAKLGKAKPSKDAGKLGKVGKEALGKGKRKLAPRISDVSLGSECFSGMFSSPSKKARTASSSQVMCLRRAGSRLHAAMGYGFKKPASASQARPWLMNPKKGNLGLISSKQMLTSPSQDLTFKVGWGVANCISLLRWLRICPSTTLPLLVRSGVPWKRTTWQKLKPWPWGRTSWKSTVHRPWHMFLEKDMHALGKGPSAAEVHQQFWKEKGSCCFSTGWVTGCIVLARNLVASGGRRVTACLLMLNACLQPCLSRLHAWPCHHTCYMHTHTQLAQHSTQLAQAYMFTNNKSRQENNNHYNTTL